MNSPFQGFPPQTLQFLAELAANNDRDWFNRNKARYEALVLQPSLSFIEAMAPLLAGFAPRFKADPRRAGGSLMRVYRDTRFSRDKRPYKTNIGIQLRHEAGKDVHAPGYYLHVEPGESFLAVGIWRPDPRSLGRLREAIQDSPAGWKRARDHAPFRRRFELVGDSLQRPPRGVAPDHPLIQDLKRKDLIASMPLETAELHRRDFAARAGKAYEAASPFMEFLCLALELPYR